MTGTCRKTECAWWKKYKTKCPHYMETLWTKEGDNVPQVVEDCAPKRAVNMLMDLYPRLEGAQKAAEKARNGTMEIVKQIAVATGQPIWEIEG